MTAAQLVRSHREAREDYYRFSVGMIGAEAMLRLFSEEEANERAFTALTRFLDLLDGAAHTAERPTLDPLGLSFQLKLLWLAGYLPHVSACAECGAEGEPLVGYSTRAGGAVCARCAPATEGARTGRGRDRRNRDAPRAAARPRLRISASPSARNATPCAWSPRRTSTTAVSGCGR